MGAGSHARGLNVVFKSSIQTSKQKLEPSARGLGLHRQLIPFWRLLISREKPHAARGESSKLRCNQLVCAAADCPITRLHGDVIETIIQSARHDAPQQLGSVP